MTPRARATTGFYGVAVVLIAVALFALFQLQRRFERDIEASLESLQRLFSEDRVLRAPGDPFVRFSAIEELAAKFEGHGNIATLTITKIFPEGERVVYPFYIPALLAARAALPPDAHRLLDARPLPKASPGKAVRVLPLAFAGRPLGNLYAKLDRGPLNTVRAVIASLGGLLIASVVLFAMQFRRQERVISRTTVELEQKHRELVRLERLALAGQLSANILHDLRKPVLNIKEEAADLMPTAAEPAARIREQVGLFFDILRDLSLERFVRAEGEREYVDLNEIVERSLALVRYEQGGVRIEKQLAPDLPPVLVAPVRLIQVLSNIILNAHQAMAGHGTLTVTTSREEDRLVARFADTGPGIPPAALAQIFTPFFTTKPPDTGTGLGLYIARDILREAGGDIEVVAASSGAVFRIVLPAGPGDFEGTVDA